MTDESKRGGGRIPPMPAPVPTPGVSQDGFVWTEWGKAVRAAVSLSPEDAGILHRACVDADLGAATYPDEPRGFGDAGAGLRRLAAAGLVTRLADGGYWPGRHGAAAAARSAQPVLDTLARLLRADTAELIGESWFRVEPAALTAAARTAGCGWPRQVFDELVGFLVEDGWLERRGDALWRFTKRMMAERGPAPGPDWPLPPPSPAPGGLRSLFADADATGEAGACRETARRAARAGGFDADHQAVLGTLAAAAEPRGRVAAVTLKVLAEVAGVSVDRVRRILRNLEAAGLVWRTHPGGRGPDVSLYKMLCLPEARMPVDEWLAGLTPEVSEDELAVVRTVAALEDPVKRVASVRLRRLAGDLGCDRTTVAGRLRRLVERGHLRIVHRGGPGRNDATRIVLRVPAAEKGG